MATHNETGKRGEEIAADYLLSEGFFILEKNWRWRYLEVDLICLEGNTLVLVEVKTRADLHHGLPEEAITRKKEQNLLEAAERYIELKEMENEIRFDIISVWEETGECQINHIREAFTGMG